MRYRAPVLSMAVKYRWRVVRLGWVTRSLLFLVDLDLSDSYILEVWSCLTKYQEISWSVFVSRPSGKTLSPATFTFPKSRAKLLPAWLKTAKLRSIPPFFLMVNLYWSLKNILCYSLTPRTDVFQFLSMMNLEIWRSTSPVSLTE